MTASDRNNNFGFLRMLFAALVIVSHSPELVDGNRSREILTRLFGTMSFGEVAVDGFFLISGYLVTRSYIGGESTLAYLARRVLRIVPGYAVSFLVCAFLIAPFVGGAAVLTMRGAARALSQMPTLSPPVVPGVFAGMHYPMLNGAMWTIAYEFRCYLAVPLLGLAGMLGGRGRWGLAGAVSALLVLNATGAMQVVHIDNEYLWGRAADSTRFAAVFGIGALYYMFRERVKLTVPRAMAAAILLTGLMFIPYLAEAAFAILGGYLIMWFALRVPVLPLSRFDNTTDISYGLYLYGWPVQTLIIWFYRGIDPWLLCGVSLSLASLLGHLSWTCVERPCLRLAPGRRAAIAPTW